jgi:hypothetical protein
MAMNWEGAVPDVAGGEHLVVRCVVATGLLSCLTIGRRLGADATGRRWA